MRVAIVGSRRFRHPQHVITYIQSLPPETVVVSGGALGVDSIAECAARKRGLQVIVHRANWTDRGAGMRRNERIVAGADRLVAFWDGSSPGTAHSISLARGRGIPVEVYLEEGGSDVETKG